MGISGYLGCITTRGNCALFAFPAEIGYTEYVEKTLHVNEQELREKIAKEIENLEIKPSVTNALGMRIQAAKAARGNGSK
jgi:hypothetical protein